MVREYIEERNIFRLLARHRAATGHPRWDYKFRSVVARYDWCVCQDWAEQFRDQEDVEGLDLTNISLVLFLVIDGDVGRYQYFLDNFRLLLYYNCVDGPPAKMLRDLRIFLNIEEGINE